jgi:ketosteroid isomerase-like protein
MRTKWIVLFASAIAACGVEGAPAPQAPERPAPSPSDAEAGAAAAEEPSAPTAESAADKQVRAIRASFEAQNTHDAAALAAFYANDVVVKAPGLPDWSGRDTVRAEEEKSFAEVPDAKWGARRILVKDDVAIVEWTSTGTSQPTKRSSRVKRFGANGVSVMRFTPEGLIKEEYDVLNEPTLTAQTTPTTGKKAQAQVRDVQWHPSGTPDVRVAQGTPEEAKAVSTLKALDHAFDVRSEKAFGELLADDVVWDDYATPAPTNGKAEVLKSFQTLVTALPDMKTTCTYWGIDEMAVQQCERAATHEGPLPLGALKVPATHVHLVTHFVDVALIKNGVVAKLWHYADNMEAATQLGLVKNGAWIDTPVVKKKKKKTD